jgi:hypothetical protein
VAAQSKNNTAASAGPSENSPAGNTISKKDEAQLFNLKTDATDLGRADSLRYNILTWVLDEQYDRAITELKDFLERPSDFPNFNKRVTRYAHHSVDLIYAIKAKRNFPGINSLTRAKQQELREKFKEHFKELQYILMRVEKVETDLRISDVRSTIYVVRALWIAGISIVFLAFALEILRGLAQTGFVVFDESITQFTNWLFGLVGL